MILGLDHCEAAAACKSESGENGGGAPLRFRGRLWGKSYVRDGTCANPRRSTAALVSKDEPMKARRMAYWWFRFVVSGRFLEKFLKLRRPWPIAATTAGPDLTRLRERSRPDVMRRGGAGVRRQRTAASRQGPARVPRSPESRKRTGWDPL